MSSWAKEADTQRQQTSDSAYLYMGLSQVYKKQGISLYCMLIIMVFLCVPK